jgi:DNA-binding beta-propeller fold protein YncE
VKILLVCAQTDPYKVPKFADDVRDGNCSVSLRRPSLPFCILSFGVRSNPGAFLAVGVPVTCLTSAGQTERVLIENSGVEPSKRCDQSRISRPFRGRESDLALHCCQVIAASHTKMDILHRFTASHLGGGSVEEWEAQDMISERNFVSGNEGLVAVDKVDNKVLFLDLKNYGVIRALDGFACRVHDLVISETHSRAFIPIYGDGIHGDNPHPGHLIAVIDLQEKRHIGDFSVSPYESPHGIRCGAGGHLYCICENSGIVVEMNAVSGTIENAMEVGSNKGHRIEVLPDCSKLYAETEEDGFISVIDLTTYKRLKKISLPSELDGLGMSPDGSTVVVVDGKRPMLYVIDTRQDEIIRTIGLEHFEKAAQIVRYSPNGEFVVVTSHNEPLGTILRADLKEQRNINLGNGPMDMAFHPNGRTVLIANQNDGTISVVDLQKAEVLRVVHAGVGIESLSFY